MPAKTNLVLKTISAEARRASPPAGTRGARQKNAARDIGERLEFRIVAERFIRWRERHR